MNAHPENERVTSTRAERGFTIVEIAFAFVIMVTATLALVRHVGTVYRRNTTHKDRVFAYTKAQNILAELQAYVNRSEDLSANTLDTLDDGVSNNVVLTIAKTGGVPVAPDHPMSANREGIDGWQWSRRVTVRPFPGLDNRNVRYVTVKVFRRRAAETWELMADLSGVVNSVGTAYPPSQVYDVYLIAIENVPGWWVHMDAIRPFVESTITDLEARNPGAKIRTHWITKASYGRNELYTPFINEAVDSRQPIPGVYMYPGRMPDDAASTYYYVPSLIKGRIRQDDTVRNDYDATVNPYPYALADNYNQAMRLPAERALFAKRLAAGLESEQEPTLRLLLEDMASRPGDYHNAILVNLHGELLPMPALRNYSDAAKSPAKFPELRVVTHPERLRFVRGDTVAASEDVTLRVYAWRTDPDSVKDPFTGAVPVTLQVMDVNLTRNVNGTGAGPVTLEIRRLPGGVDAGDGDPRYRAFERAPKSATLPREMYYEVSWVDETGSGGEKYTLIKLHNTPSVARRVDDRGLDASRRLYDLEYVPCSTEASNDFSVDLASTGVRPKNTARWQLRIPKAVLDGAGTGSGLTLDDQVLAIRSRIGADLTTGVAHPARNDPDNLSTTWVWWTDSADDVPHTERYQFLGDPRHCPYADLKDGGATFPNGYNWFFDDLVNGTANARPLWPGFSGTRLRDGWQGRIEADWPRFAQLVRKAMTSSEVVFTTLTGFSYYYLGLGGEIGYDAANGYPSSIPVSLYPYGRTGWSYADSIASGGAAELRGQKIVRASGVSDYWWGMYWLGELYPDDQWSLWQTAGNLPAGPLAGFFQRTLRPLITRNLPYGTRLANTNRTTQAEGCTSLFNIGTTSSTFHHQYRTGTNGSLVGAGLELAANYNFPLPTTTKISRPFGITVSYDGGVGDEWYFPVDYPRGVAVIERTFYEHQGGQQGSAIVGLTDPVTRRAAHIVVNGLDTTIESGTSFIAKYAVLTLLHAYFEASGPSVASGTRPLPRVVIASPTEISELVNPDTVDIRWSVKWRRWDGRKYAESFPDTYTQSESDLEYVLSYSADNGTSYRYVQDGVLATPGIRPASSSHIVADQASGDESFLWDTPAAQFPEGSYLVRVEAYRRGEALHYSYHQTKVFIQRSGGGE